MRYGVRKKKELVLWGILCVGLILLYLLSSTDWIIKEKEVEYPCLPESWKKSEQ